MQAGLLLSQRHESFWRVIVLAEASHQVWKGRSHFSRVHGGVGGWSEAVLQGKPGVGQGVLVR